ncbi:hypothetical protein GA0111570_102168 [Raineyella antarctica]|uniref:DUF6884 domain-containing protein n=1 Tax=Raineyella antarctica TaxID=1577474 RepID=A0A1G6GEE9_9ACTN|nr:DUF6884 domain-containing protein [Raineyella antarctica]SDB80378.1 hypothetical protein GA0111570_102168 [Raineyella antarctica]
MGTWESPGNEPAADAGNGLPGGSARPAPWQPAATPPPLAAQLADSDADQPVPADAPAGTPADAAAPDAEPAHAPRRAAQLPSAPSAPTMRPDLVLVEDSREQLDHAAPAGDLFTSELFVRARAYARSTGAPWFVMSAEYGLLAPEHVVGPYDRNLATVPTAYREAWGPWALARLELVAGSLRRKRIELHALSYAASEGIRRQLLGLGALVLEPLRGLSVADRIAWYDAAAGGVATPAAHAAAGSGAAGDADAAVLGDAAGALSPSRLLASVDASLRQPGLYSWFVDEVGAAQLSEGLGAHVSPGLVWVGQAGALRPGSGLSSTATLRTQIAWVHLGRSVRLSPLRRILGSALSQVPDSGVTSEDALTDWMHTHLRIATSATIEPENLAERAEVLAARLVPQLSAEHAPDPEVRAAVSRARLEFDGFPAR